MRLQRALGLVLLFAASGSYAYEELKAKTITLSSRRGPSRRTLKRRFAARDINEPLADDFLGTDLQYGLIVRCNMILTVTRWFGNISGMYNTQHTSSLSPV